MAINDQDQVTERTSTEYLDPQVEQMGGHMGRLAEHIWSAPASDRAVLLLRPLAAAFGALVHIRRNAYERGWLRAQRATIPAISVGNLTVGGAGKTPFTRWLATRLSEHGQRVAILHGGYAPDEPLLHKRWQPNVPVYSGRDRSALARVAARDGATVLLLDDGRQHLRLARDLDIVLIAADSWHRPPRLLPAGSWREPLGTLRPADAVVITRKAASVEQARAVVRAVQIQSGVNPLAIAALEPAGWTDLQGTPLARPPTNAIIACAVAEPRALVQQVRDAGVRIQQLLTFKDHHEYTPDDLRQIRVRAAGQDIVITEKDAGKILALDPLFPACVLLQRVVIETGESELWSMIRRVLP